MSSTDLETVGDGDGGGGGGGGGLICPTLAFVEEQVRKLDW